MSGLAADPWTWDLATCGRELSRGRLSSVELLEAVLGRVAVTRRLNVFIRELPDGALGAARASDARRARGAALGPMDGVPVALKDLLDVRDAPTTAGSGFHAAPAARDAVVTARLRSAGAVLLGKTHTHEWALGVTSVNPHFGPARNPWDPERIAGGSSGGNAAGLAVGAFAGAFGTDTGGSVRIPAALCGVAALKPTRGRVSTRGVVPLSVSLDHVGPMARGVADLARLLAAVDDPAAGRQAGDAPDAPDAPGLRDLRIGVPRELLWSGLDAEVEALCRRALGVLESLGAEVVPIESGDWHAGRSAAGRILLFEAADVHRARLDRYPDAFGDDVRHRLRTGATLPAAEVAAARAVRASWRVRVDQALAAVSCLVGPTTPVAAPRIAEADGVRAAARLTSLTSLFNLTGHPALSLPCGFTSEGLPVGLQLVGRRWGDAGLLALGAAVEAVLDLPRRFPPIG